MKTMKALAGAVILAAALAAGGAQASVTRTYNFTLGDFVDGFGSAAPPSTSVTGSFTVTFDLATGFSNDTADITLNSLSGVTIDSPFSFGGGPFGGGQYFMSVGGLANGPGGIAGGTNDFVLQLQFGNPASVDTPVLVTCASAQGYFCGSETDQPGPTASGYTRSDSGHAWFATSGSITSNGGVPEPASWALMLLGFGGLGAMMRTRRRLALA